MLYIRKKISLTRSYVVKLKNICVVNEDSCPELYYSAEQVSDIIRSNNSLLTFFADCDFIVLN